MQGDHVQAVIQIFAEVSGFHLGFQVAVGGRHNAHIHLFATAAAHPFDFLLLQHAQNLDLEAQLHFADFIQKNGAAVSQFKTARPGADGVRKGALFVTEKFAFQQFFGDSPAVDGYKRFVGATAVGVQGAHQQLLACSGFAGYKHSAVSGGHLAENSENVGQRGALADNAACI